MSGSETTEGPDPSEAESSWLIEKLNCIWEVVQDLGRVFRYTRLSILVNLLAGLALILTGQGQDLIVIHAEEPWSLFLFYPAIVFWAVNAWYWARVTLRHCWPIPVQESCKTPYFCGRAARVEWLVAHVPRLIGTAAFVLIAVAQYVASGREGLAGPEQSFLEGLALLTLGLAAAFYLLVLLRRRLSRALGRAVSAAGKGKPAPGWLMLSATPEYVRARRMADLPRWLRRSFAAFATVLLLAFLLATFVPTWLGWLRADVVFLVGASLWIAPGTWLILFGRQGRLPILSFLVVLALVFSFFNDNHAVRTLAGAEPYARSELKDALKAWQAQWKKQPPPSLVLVATAGGGSRAAYWTGSLLGTLQDLEPDFVKRLFAISGVSGGSLGAAVFRSLLTARPDADTNCEGALELSSPYRDCARAILGQGFLSSTVAAMIFPDLVQRFLPVPLLPDRAEALEEAWEAAWDRHLEGGLLGADFFASWPEGGTDPAARDLPALLLNGTSVATGKRIVTSNLRLEEHLNDAYDFFSRCRVGIRMSTAADNSARFPIVGPAGTLDKGGCDFGRPFDRIVDGGYFENFGADTALDLVQALRALSCAEAPQPCGLDVVVIQISSDPSYRGVTRRADPAAPAQDGDPLEDGKAPIRFASELLAPIETLLNTRGAHGDLAAQRLYDWVAGNSMSRFVEFRLIRQKGESEPPLGWVLSEAAKTSIDCQLLAPENLASLEQLGGLLGFEPEAFVTALRKRCSERG